MVNTTLPLPILKYLEMQPGAVETILLEYPFYQLPRVARILTHSQNLDNDGQDHNFFGFNKQKLNQYIRIFQQHSMEPIVAKEDIDQPIEISSNPEVPFNDVDIIVSELEELSEEEKSRIINDQTIELVGDSSIEESPTKEEILIEYDLEGNDFDLTSEELEPIPLQVESIEIDFENELLLPDEELGEKLSRELENQEITEDKGPILDGESEHYIEIPNISDNNTSSSTMEPLDIELGEINTISDEELASKLEIETPFNASEESTLKLIEEIEADIAQFAEDTVNDIDNLESTMEVEIGTEEEDVLELGSLKADVETLDSDDSILFETEAPIPNYILPAGLELLEKEKLENQAEQIEFIESEVEVELEEVKLSELDNEKVEVDVKDFNSWLAAFSTQPDSIEKKSTTEIIAPIDQDTIELERNIQYSAQQSQLLASYEDEETEIPKINRDDELEGVLQDNFFKSQVEIKKATRKTPSEMRIQDEAQLSLQPLNLVSETMAILHAQQGNTSKSIEIYQKLIRLFPEKSSFFALQIKNLRK